MTTYLDQYHRQSLWDQHDARCNYCNHLVEYKNFQVDHIIPTNSFSGKEDELKKKYSLDDSFDFNSLDNFVPSCQNCNTVRKRAKELEGGIPIWLDTAAAKKEEIIKAAKKLEHELSLSLPDQYKNFFLSSPDFLLSRIRIDSIRKDDIDKLKELSFDENYYPLYLTSPQNDAEKILIRNLRMYEEYSEKKYFPHTTPEIGLASVCMACLIFLERFENAVANIDSVEFQRYFPKLPIEILTLMTCEDDKYEGFQTIGQFFASMEDIDIKFLQNSASIEITYKYEDGLEEIESYKVEEILQADFSGEGFLEIMLFVHYRSAGTLHFSSPYTLRYIDDEWSILKIL